MAQLQALLTQLQSLLTGFQLVDNWKQFYKMRSVQLMAIVAILPELLQLAVDMDILSADDVTVPAFFNKLLKCGLFLAAVGRLLKQKGITLEAPAAPAAA